MRCKTCKFAKWTRTDRGNIRTSRPGECLYEVPLPDKIPLSAKRHYGYETKSPYRKQAIWIQDYEECDCHEEIKTKKEGQ